MCFYASVSKSMYVLFYASTSDNGRDCSSAIGWCFYPCVDVCVHRHLNWVNNDGFLSFCDWKLLFCDWFCSWAGVCRCVFVYASVSVFMIVYVYISNCLEARMIMRRDFSMHRCFYPCGGLCVHRYLVLRLKLLCDVTFVCIGICMRRRVFLFGWLCIGVWCSSLSLFFILFCFCLV